MFQIWDVIKHYLCDISYGTPESILNNVAYVDLRPSFLLPNIWTFYYAERLFLLKLLQYIIESKDDPKCKYSNEFRNIYTKLNESDLKNSLINQLANVINTTPPPRKITSDIANENIRKEWAESNLREQFIILQILLLIANESSFTDVEFKKLFELFRKHEFGKSQGYMEMLEQRHKEHCLRITHIEIAIFMTIVNADQM